MVMVARNALPLRGAPNGLFYEDLSDTLFIADERDSSIVMIPSGHPPRVVARIPAGCSQRPSIGGLARSPDGTFFVARLGWGEAGAVVRVTDQVTILDGTDPTWWHLGVAYDERNGILWATAFERPAFRGWLMAIDPQSGRVVERVGGFQKPVGVIAAAGSVWLADQRGGCIYKITNSTIAPICEGLPQPDSLAIADAESCFVTCWDEASRTGSVEQIHLDGTRRTVASGPWRPRGIASDGAFRLFVAPRNESRVIVFPHTH